MREGSHPLPAFLLRAVSRAIEKAGLKAGDVITTVDGKAIATADDLIKAIRSHSIGDTIQVNFYRGNNLQSAAVTLAENPH